MKNKGIRLSKYFRSNIIVFILLIIADIGVAISMVIWSLFMKGLADVGTKGDIMGIKKLLLFGIIFLIFSFVINNFQYFCSRYFLRKVNYQLKRDIFNAILSKNINDFNESNSAKFISILNNDIVTIENNYFINIPNIIENIITFLVATITLFVYEPLIAIVILLLSCIPMLIPMIFGKKISEKQKKYFNFLEIYNTKIKDIFNGFEIIKSFNADNEANKLHTSATKDVENSRFDFRKSQSISWVIQHTLTYTSCIIQLTFSIYFVLKGKITLGVFLGIMQISNYVNNPIRQASKQLVNLKSIKSIKIKIEEILNVPKQDENSKFIGENLIESAPIKLNNLSYGYDVSSLVLKNINFNFEEGKKYALVGSSGSGKSTLVKLIMKYYDAYQGEIIIGTQNLKNIDKTSLNNNFSMIHQRVIIFDDTLKNNITMFKEYSKEHVQQAIKCAGLDELIRSLPEGVDTKVHESGNNFSGGEQQRISIARAFLKNTSVMILDEATSSLDNKTAMKIENIVLEKKELTAIVVTHKLVPNTLRKYDCIVTLNHGRIEEYGSFDELMNNKGYFYSLYTINS
ncbi:ABC transporter ATP-binding protein [Haloimpatiens massiliensis]|uniref:ABC transporter ATP-binding protein n=1 Tax=Haloimpatiens massiliensis TaxID=1658110 RepID=UPI000C828806|nr:ABC transporter ATP-binding protein [Haloimpatiens massiliensis]